jgi:hypothetical protein
VEADPSARDPYVNQGAETFYRAGQPGKTKAK